MKLKLIVKNLSKRKNECTKKGEIKLIKNISLMTVDKKHKFYQAEMLSRKILYSFA